tara:strand:- start:788 stop:1708 length:921 start_codon:yes stop_codon:yes gene_type:complete
MKLKIIQATVIIFIFNVAYADNNREYNEIIENLRCLVCQNQSLAESDSNLAKDLRSKVKSMLESGKSQDNIYKFMSDRYTDYVLYNPPVKKSTWFLWFSPFIILAASIFYLFFIFNRNKNKYKSNNSQDNNRKKNNIENNISSVEKKINTKYLYIFILIFIPIITLSIYSYSSEYMRYKILYYFETREPIIDITVVVHDDILSKITGNEVLFVYARRSNGMRIPLAIDIFDVTKMKKNYNVKLDNTMSMIKDQTLSSAKEIIVEARISKNKKAMTMPGDYIGSSLPIKIGPSNYLLIKINSIVTGE